jgi:dihydroneopterin aldolase
VVFLGDAALRGPGLPALLGLFAGAPVVLCVGPPDTAAPVAETEAAQRRIDLLAIEQAAWALASRDPRLLVVGTRTELDWALRQDRTCVWAPSKIVLDTVDGPQATEGLSLAAWLAGKLRAAELRVIGASPPEGFVAPVPLVVEAEP